MFKVHKVQTGETLTSISTKYYGTASRWPQIRDANPQLIGRQTAVDFSPLIYTGDILNIPSMDDSAVPQKVESEVVFSKTGDKKISIVIGGVKFTGFTSYELTDNFDSFDTFCFSANYDLENEQLKKIIKPFSYPPVSVFYGDELQFNGTLLTPDCELSEKEKTITLQGYPVCGVLNDCALPPTKYPAQYDGKNIKEIAEDAAGAYGIGVVLEGSTGAVFKSVSYEPEEKIISFISKLVKQRGLLFSNDSKGQLILFSPKKKKSIASFAEGKAPLIGIRPGFNAQGFYSHITGFTKTTEKSKSLKFTYENKFLIKQGVLRCHSYVVEDADSQSDLEQAVKAYAGRMFANAVTYELEVEGHATSNGNLYKKGQIISVESKTAKILKPTEFLIRTARKTRDVSGNKSVLSVVLPGAFTGEIPEVLPWEE